MEIFNNYFVNIYKNNYANFNGRARRSEYWYFTLFYIIVIVLLTILDIALGTYDAETESGYITMVFQLASLVPMIALTVRRMHDVGKSGWFMLIPIYNFILSVTDSEPGTNQYGPNPKNPAADDVMDHLVG